MAGATTGPQLPDPFAELAARADAGQKLGMQALEFVMNLAASQGKRLDFNGAAVAMESSPVVSTLDPGTAAIETRSRQITADILRKFANVGA